MNTMITPALFTREKSYKVLDSLDVNIRVEDNPFDLPPEHIFALAARNNAKRSYLFVSKLIGKHIPVHPQVPFITGYLLATRVAQTLNMPVNIELLEQAVNCLTQDTACFFQPFNWDQGPVPLSHRYRLPGKTLVVGFAETATALGHAAFSCFSGDINYMHTTRENITGSLDTIYFTEEHSHAPDQRLIINSLDPVTDNELCVLVDDEITSGNTCLNIIQAVHANYPQPRYLILTILDWRSKNAQANFHRLEQQLGVPIEVLSLCQGRFWSQGAAPVINSSFTAAAEIIPAVNMLQLKTEHEIELTGPGGQKAAYLSCTGRFGINEKDQADLMLTAKELGKKLLSVRQGRKTLCLGTGEFMYLPFIIASFMGEGVLVQSTTRSPVHPMVKKDYAVRYAITFEDPFNPGIKNFVYNIPPGYYDEVFVFWERRVTVQRAALLVQSLKQLGISRIHFVNLC